MTTRKHSLKQIFSEMQKRGMIKTETADTCKQKIETAINNICKEYIKQKSSEVEDPEKFQKDIKFVVDAFSGDRSQILNRSVFEEIQLSQETEERFMNAIFKAMKGALEEYFSIKAQWQIPNSFTNQKVASFILEFNENDREKILPDVVCEERYCIDDPKCMPLFRNLIEWGVFSDEQKAEYALQLFRNTMRYGADHTEQIKLLLNSGLNIEYTDKNGNRKSLLANTLKAAFAELYNINEELSSEYITQERAEEKKSNLLKALSFFEDRNSLADFGFKDKKGRNLVCTFLQDQDNDTYTDNLLYDGAPEIFMWIIKTGTKNGTLELNDEDSNGNTTLHILKNYVRQKMRELNSNGNNGDEYAAEKLQKGKGIIYAALLDCGAIPDYKNKAGDFARGMYFKIEDLLTLFPYSTTLSSMFTSREMLQLLENVATMNPDFAQDLGKIAKRQGPIKRTCKKVQGGKPDEQKTQEGE